MWVLSFFPDSFVSWIIYLIISAGLGAYILSKFISIIPIISNYKLLLEIAGIAVLSAGMYMQGHFVADSDWKEQIAKVEQKLKVAQENSNKTNIVIQEQVVTKIKTIKDTVYVNKEIIVEVAGPQLDSQCTLPKSAVSVLDSASQNEVARGPGSVDGTTSDVKASDVLTTVVENYGTCYEIREKLIGWQTWYKEQKKIFEDAQK